MCSPPADGPRGDKPVLEIDVNIAANTLNEVVDLGQIAEDAGAARIAVWDSPAITADCWTALGALSQQLRSVPVGLSVTNPMTRHPVVTANAARSIAEFTSGRMFLGIGSGDSGVVNLGVARSKQSYLREYVACVRDLLVHGRAQWEGHEVYLSRSSPFPVPIYIAAHGMRSLRTAAEIGDGIMVGLGVSPEVIERVTASVADTCARIGRDPSTIDCRWSVGGIAIASSEEEATQQLGWLVAPMAHHFARQGPQSSLVPAGLADRVRSLGLSYDLSIHGRSTALSKDRYLQTAKDLGVWDYLRERFLICGTAETIGERLQELAKHGVTKFEVSTSVCGADGVLAILQLAREINSPEGPDGKLRSAQ